MDQDGSRGGRGRDRRDAHESNLRHAVWEPMRNLKRPRATCEISRQPFDKGRNASDRFPRLRGPAAEGPHAPRSLTSSAGSASSYLHPSHASGNVEVRLLLGAVVARVDVVVIGEDSQSLRDVLFVRDAYPHRTAILTGVVQVELSTLGVGHD